MYWTVTSAARYYETKIVKIPSRVRNDQSSLKNLDPQGYQDRVFFKPSTQLSCCSGSELALNLEVCLFPGASIDGSIQYMLDTRDLKPDKEFAKVNACIHRVEQLGKLVDHVGKSFPAVMPFTEFGGRFLKLAANFMKRSETPIIEWQIKKQVENDDKAYWKMQGRHVENTATKMAHRSIKKKSYIVKKPLKFFDEAMHENHLVCDLEAKGAVPGQLSMGCFSFLQDPNS